MPEGIIFVLVMLGGAFTAGLVSGLTGFGTGLVALGIWLHVMDPLTAVPLVLACSILPHLLTLRQVLREASVVKFLPLIGGGVFGVPIGVLCLPIVNPGLLTQGLAVFLVLYSGTALVGAHGGIARGLSRRWDALAGFFGGALGGASGLSGPIPAIWATSRGWKKEEQRLSLQAFNLTILVIALSGHAATGHIETGVWRAIAMCMPVTVLGSLLGWALYKRLNDKNFTRIVLALVAISGVSLLIK